MTPLDKWSTRHRDLYLTTHNSHKTQTSMPPAGFEPAIPQTSGHRPTLYTMRPLGSATDPRFTPCGHWDRPQPNASLGSAHYCFQSVALKGLCAFQIFALNCMFAIIWRRNKSQKQHRNSHCENNDSGDNSDTVNTNHSRPLPSHKEALQSASRIPKPSSLNSLVIFFVYTIVLRHNRSQLTL